MKAMHGEYKTPGGKLVMVDFDVEGGELRNVVVSGDFFLYPEEALASISQALEQAPVDSSEDELVLRVESSLPAGTELVGFSPQAVVTAVKRGMQ